MKARFCSQCGSRVQTRPVAGRAREVCPSCGTVFYRNPLPVAAAVVVNPHREVLLVKRRRPPRQGLWCLPMGFAELQETIAHASLRELNEETGVSGRVVRLLAAESVTVDPYGDLLVVTFEAQKLGGGERPGDDAEAVGYFSPDALPPLAFTANQRAIRACVQAHREEWAIHDSFQHLREAPGQALLSDPLVAFATRHARAIANAWLHDVQNHPTTPSYARADTRRLLERVHGVLSHFSEWLANGDDRRDVRHFYRELGRERHAMGFTLPEVLSSLTLLRKHILTHSRAQDVWRSPLDVYRVLELEHRVILFFDKAMYHTARGYTSAPLTRS
ncbi:MAG: NUDIX hydrolase [Verrucomicrobia bacterium]|nr:NUDIX hydrolase [Verrucomicrobiota bacterium]